ncbi:hypothetical protein KP509_20G023800 [Ceratopteris richardii]|uniref:Inositol polyphosphate-related phosphatase domain-containing protein n=1 Tax=Ceratopteris richardii TaxID=49495 RepID=A0A8T2SDU5_CERRI|nr:hypothetical protein KP509_20G023800 [Ceratopteris richardii]
MRKQNKKRGELLWPRMVMKKWLNIESEGDEFSADECSADEHDDADDADTDNESDSEWESIETKPIVPKRHTTRKFSLQSLNGDGRQFIQRKRFDTKELRIAVGSWNVAGKTPSPYLDLKNWLETRNPADIYVLGFQEVVPLNAGNVFGTEDNRATFKWQTLIRETLNRADFKDTTCYSAPPSPSRDANSAATDSLSEESEMDSHHFLIEEETSIIPLEFPHSQSTDQDAITRVSIKTEVYRCTEGISVNGLRHQRTNSEPMNWLCTLEFPLDGGLTDEDTDSLARPLLSPIPSKRMNYCKKGVHYVRVASKQMVGIHISVWVRKKLRRFIHNLTVSCVGLGIMGCMGNKGSISVSMLLHETSFCFVCTHLSSGEKEGAELHRNADVAEILKRTRFRSTQGAHTDVPRTICDHDRIIWLGDLNYRLNMSNSNARFLVSREDWTALLEKDQLKKELSKGRVFEGWHEGMISFPPTYKYVINSNHYVGESNGKNGEKRRVPVWEI